MYVCIYKRVWVYVHVDVDVCFIHNVECSLPFMFADNCYVILKATADKLCVGGSSP